MTQHLHITVQVQAIPRAPKPPASNQVKEGKPQGKEEAQERPELREDNKRVGGSLATSCFQGPADNHRC